MQDLQLGEPFSDHNLITAVCPRKKATIWNQTLAPDVRIWAPFCVILTEQIQLICNVSIKNLAVAENYAFLGSYRELKQQIRTLDNALHYKG